MGSAVLHRDVGADHQIPDRSRGKDLTWPSGGHHPSGKVHDGGNLMLAADGLVGATGGTRLLGLGGSEVHGPRRTLHAVGTDRITAVAAARNGGRWLGTPQGLFHVNRSVLHEG